MLLAWSTDNWLWGCWNHPDLKRLYQQLWYVENLFNTLNSIIYMIIPRRTFYRWIHYICLITMKMHEWLSDDFGVTYPLWTALNSSASRFAGPSFNLNFLEFLLTCTPTRINLHSNHFRPRIHNSPPLPSLLDIYYDWYKCYYFLTLTYSLSITAESVVGPRDKIWWQKNGISEQTPQSDWHHPGV